MVQQEYAARSATIGSAQSADVYSIGPAMNRVQPGIACAAKDFLGLNHFHDFGLARIRFGVENVDAGRAQPGHDQVAPLYVRVGSIRAQRRTAGIPAEVMQFIACPWHLNLADHTSEARRLRVDVHDGHLISSTIAVRIECSYVSQLF